MVHVRGAAIEADLDAGVGELRDIAARVEALVVVADDAHAHAAAVRIEHRQGAADINPYVAIAASVGAGLWGIENRLAPPRQTQGDPGDSGPHSLPRTLREAIDKFTQSKAARQLFGAEFVDHYAMTREWEARSFERAVTTWELERYFESI